MSCEKCHGSGKSIFQWTEELIRRLMPWRQLTLPLKFISIVDCECVGGTGLPCCHGPAEMLCYDKCPRHSDRRSLRIFEDVQYGKKTPTTNT